MRYIKLQHELIHARFDEDTGKWHLKIQRPAPDFTLENKKYEVIEDVADFVVSGIGLLSRWSWPDIDGLNDFKGKLMHSAEWDMQEQSTWEDGVKDWRDKKVGVIGVVSLFLVQ